MKLSFGIKHFARRLWREFVFPAALMLLIVAPLRSAVADWNWVPTGSMKPTILEGDMVFINKLAYDLKVPFTTHRLAQWSEPCRGEVVVFFSPENGDRLVKRVIGLPGDVVAMRNGALSINGQTLRYQTEALAPYLKDIFEDPRPIIATEFLEKRRHLVMALPQRTAALRTFGPYTVPAGTYFMMGDSRDNSHDSRFFGSVQRGQIVGRATTVLFSVDLKRYLLPRFGRFAHPLDPS